MDRAPLLVGARPHVHPYSMPRPSTTDHGPRTTDKRTSVALVITDLDVGGAERALTALATRLSPARWRVGVFCLSGEGALAPVIREAGLPCECLGVGRRDPVRAVARLASALRRFRPDLVQGFLFHA